jgi:hypothetical protein
MEQQQGHYDSKISSQNKYKRVYGTAYSGRKVLVVAIMIRKL